ncbi:MAG: HEXXH motif-containing putative peptide modification protein [Myxococcales bacterium]|nr:HEXXH motif-containing putative peptide modification protein [Polyangiaceae bacterium]MDW8251334.1 HEXXH motif-containing putative peptide modification protein [Myxococcales bacterium]
MGPPQLPRCHDLTLPVAGSSTIRQLLSLALLQARSTLSGLSSPEPTDPRAALRRLLPTLDPGFLLSALRRPSRLTLARCLATSPLEPQRSSWGRSLAASLCLDAAEVGLLPGPLEFAFEGELLSERSGWVLRLPQGTHLLLASGQIELRTHQGASSSTLPASPEQIEEALQNAGVPAQRAHFPLWDNTVLLLHDTNPLAEIEAHPAKSGNRVDLGGHSPEQWRDALQGAFQVIQQYLPEIAHEMDLLLGHIGPVGYFDQAHLSASYLEATGVVYLSLHPHRMTLVEALVHEFQHNKLNLFLGLDPALENADWPLYASPVRPDPRPLRGVLLAVHAFQPIVKLYERLCGEPTARESEQGWRRQRLGEVARLCREGCDVLLPHGKPTVAGRPLLEEIRELDERFKMLLGAG